MMSEAQRSECHVEQLVRPCTCPECVSCCERNPGWMTPEEAVKSITAGLGWKLMRDWLEPCSEVGNEDRIYLLAPASIGCEGADAPEFSFADMLFGKANKGRCVFLEDGLCGLHATDYKPRQCRETMGCVPGVGPDNYEMARLWDTDEGREALILWSNSDIEGKDNEAENEK